MLFLEEELTVEVGDVDGVQINLARRVVWWARMGAGIGVAYGVAVGRSRKSKGKRK